MSTAIHNSTTQGTTTTEYLSKLYGAHDLDGLYMAVTALRRTSGPVTRYVAADDIERIAATVAELDTIADGTGVFLAQTLSAKPGSNRPGGRFDAQDAAAMTHVWTDIDVRGPEHTGKAYPPDLASARKLVDDMGLVPTLVKRTKGGLHAEWHLEELVRLDNDADRAEAATVLKGWIGTMRVRADVRGKWAVDGVHDLARIMRVPGSTHRKDPADPEVVEVIEYNPGATYSYDDLRAMMVSDKIINKVTSQDAATVEKQRAVLGCVDLIAAWKRAKHDMATIGQPRWLAQMRRDLDDLVDEFNTFAIWDHPEGRDDSGDDQGLANTVWWFSRDLGNTEALTRAAEAIMCARIRHGRRLEKVDQSIARPRVDYLARTLAKASEKATPEDDRTPERRLRDEADAIGREQAITDAVSIDGFTEQEARAILDAETEPEGAPEPDTDQVPTSDEPADIAEAAADDAGAGVEGVKVTPISGKDFTTQKHDDLGNGERFALAYAGDLIVEDAADKPINWAWAGTHYRRASPGWIGDAAGRLARAMGRQSRALLKAEDKQAAAEAKTKAENPAEPEPEPEEKKRGRPKSPPKTNGEAFAVHVSKTRSIGGLGAMAARGLMEPIMRRDPDDFRREELRQLFNTVSATLRFDRKQNVTATPHSKADLLTVCSPTPYDPTALAPGWCRFLQEVLPDPDVRRVVQVLLGLALIGWNVTQQFGLFIGKSGTGKSTILKIVSAVMGQDYAASFKTAFLRADLDADKATPELMRLTVKRLIWASEAGSKRIVLDGEQIKRINGGDPLSGRPLWKDSQDRDDRVPEFTMILATNSAPSVTHVDDGFKRRLVTVPFNEVRPALGQDDRFARDLATAEGPGILLWLLEGARLYGENPALLRDLPEACARLAEEVCGEMSVYTRWLTNHTEIIGGNTDEPDRAWATTCTDAWSMYKDAVRKANEDVKLIGNESEFRAFLKGIGFERKKVRVYAREGSTDTTPQWVWGRLLADGATWEYLRAIPADLDLADFGGGITIGEDADE